MIAWHFHSIFFYVLFLALSPVAVQGLIKNPSSPSSTVICIANQGKLKQSSFVFLISLQCFRTGHNLTNNTKMKHTNSKSEIMEAPMSKPLNPPIFAVKVEGISYSRGFKLKNK